LSERLGKQVIVDNRGGAGGVLGTEVAATPEPAGHTLLIISVAYAFNPALYKLRFDPEKAFVPVAMLGPGPNALTISPKLPANSVKELIALAKAQPGKLNYACGPRQLSARRQRAFQNHGGHQHRAPFLSKAAGRRWPTSSRAIYS
jgi:tripartite-type tricarboxylate transporter receptor subunit TctC